MYSTKMTETIETTDEGITKTIVAERHGRNWDGKASELQRTARRFHAEAPSLLRELAEKLPMELTEITVTFSVSDDRVVARATFEERPAGPGERERAASIPSFAIGTVTT